MKRLESETLYGNWATLLLATDKKGNIDYERLSDEIDVLVSIPMVLPVSSTPSQ